MKGHIESLEPSLESQLELLRYVPPRNPQSAERTKQIVLTKARVLRDRKKERPDLGFLPGLQTIREALIRKERFFMVTPIVGILVALALLFGGTGGAVYAAQDALPGDFLYPVNEITRQVQMNTVPDEPSRLELQLRFTNRLAQQIQSRIMDNQELSPQVALEYQQRLQEALRMAAVCGDPEFSPALERLRQTLREQLRLFDQKQSGNGVGDQAMAQMREMVQSHLGWVEAGIEEPELFRLRFRAGESAGGESAGMGPNPLPGDGTPFQPGVGVLGTPVPGEGIGPGPFGSQTPVGGGPGPQATCICTPRAGQTATQIIPMMGGNPSQTPRGPQPSSTCTPQAGPGPQATPQPGSSGTGGTGGQPTSPPENGFGGGDQPTTSPGSGSPPNPPPGGGGPGGDRP